MQQLRERGKTSKTEGGEGSSSLVEELEKKELFATPLNVYLTASFALITLQGFLFIGEGSFKLFTVDYKTPIYADHDHHLCHVLIFLLMACIVWYFVHVVAIVRNREAMNQNWALRFLGIPNVLVGLSEFGAFAVLFWTYDDHNETTYASVLSFGTGVLLLVVGLFTLTVVQIPLRRGRPYVWTWIVLDGIFAVALFLICYFNNLLLPTFLLGFALVPLAFGLFEARRTLDLHALYGL